MWQFTLLSVQGFLRCGDQSVGFGFYIYNPRSYERGAGIYRIYVYSVFIATVLLRLFTTVID